MPELQVAQRWFRVTRVDDVTTRLEEPFADPWVSANCWHLQGRDRDLVIDTGLGVASLRDELRVHFPEREPVAVVTHAHLDHLGSAHEFTECWAHELEPTQAVGQGTLSGRKLLEILGLEDLSFEPPAETLISALPRADYRAESYALTPVTPTRRLVDGDVIDLGDRTLRVLHLPGHTPGSIGLMDEASGALFAGDVVYDPPALLDTLKGSDRAAYAASMRRLLSLEVEVVHAGHGESFGRDRLHEIVTSYLSEGSA